MGDISDFYVNGMLEKHMNPDRELARLFKEEQEKRDRLLINMDDKKLIDISAESLMEGNFNEKYEKVSRGILRDYNKYKMKLSDKQRSALYGLLSYFDLSKYI